MTALSYSGFKHKLSFKSLEVFFDEWNAKLAAKEDVIIPKPKKDSKFKGWREVRGSKEKGFFYELPSGTKNVKQSDWEAALNQLSTFGFIDRFWFKDLPSAKSNPCNFTTIGGVLKKYELVVRSKSGNYHLKEPYLSITLKGNLKKAIQETKNNTPQKSLTTFLDEV